MKASIKIGVGTIITLALAVILIIALFVVFNGQILTVPGLFQNLTKNNSVVIP